MPYARVLYGVIERIANICVDFVVLAKAIFTRMLI